MSASRRDARALAIGSAVSGLLAYLVFALTTRGLGAEQAGPVSVLWSYWAFAGAAFTFPIQHWVAHSVTAHGEVSVRRSVPLLCFVELFQQARGTIGHASAQGPASNIAPADAL